MRGILMIAIVIGHVSTDGLLRRWVFSFHVPAFFFLSGFCFHYTERFGSFLLKKVRTIVIPYFFFSLISICIFWIGSMVMPSLSSMVECDPVKNVWVMLYGNSKPEVMRYNLPLWFLPCLFTTSLFGFGTETIARKFGKVSRFLVIAIFVALGIFFSINENIALPWHTETACSMAVWFVLGIIVQEAQITEKLNSRPLIPACLICIVGGVLLSMLNTRAVGVRNEHYGIIPLYYATAALGIIGIGLLSMSITRGKVLEYIGINSLVVLGFHKFPILVFQEIIPITKRLLSEPDSAGGMVAGMLVTIISIAFSLIASMFINRFTPWMIGKRKVKH